jgi:hypothetical protein
MKTLFAFAFSAALLAFVALPVAFEIGASLLVAAGVLGITLSDYSRRVRPLSLPEAAPAPAHLRRTERFGLAA